MSEGTNSDPADDPLLLVRPDAKKTDRERAPDRNAARLYCALLAEGLFFLTPTPEIIERVRSWAKYHGFDHEEAVLAFELYAENAKQSPIMEAWRRLNASTWRIALRDTPYTAAATVATFFFHLRSISPEPMIWATSTILTALTGQSRMQVWRILQLLEKRGFCQAIERGRADTNPSKRRATRYVVSLAGSATSARITKTKHVTEKNESMLQKSEARGLRIEPQGGEIDSTKDRPQGVFPSYGADRPVREPQLLGELLRMDIRQLMAPEPLPKHHERTIRFENAWREASPTTEGFTQAAISALDIKSKPLKADVERAIEHDPAAFYDRVLSICGDPDVESPAGTLNYRLACGARN